MTAVPSSSAPVWQIPGHDVGDEEVDVLALAGQPTPDGGAWLWVTSAESQPGGELAGLVLPGNRSVAFGGTCSYTSAWPVSGPAAARVQVWAVAAGSQVRVASWDPAKLDAWPELVRDPVVFAMGALTALEEHGADVADREQVDVITAAGLAPAGFPSLPTQVNAGG